MSGTLFCQIRKKEVADTPEERVRQEWIHLMGEKLGFPLSHIAIELSLQQMPHLLNSGVAYPPRRADLVVFSPDLHPGHPLYPLLLIECKKGAITKSALMQVSGYNFYLKSCFYAVAGLGKIALAWDDQEGKHGQCDFLPTYNELLTFGKTLVK